MTRRFDYCYGYATLATATWEGQPVAELTRYGADGKLLDIIQCDTWKDAYRWARHFARVEGARFLQENFPALYASRREARDVAHYVVSIREAR